MTTSYRRARYDFCWCPPTVGLIACSLFPVQTPYVVSILFFIDYKIVIKFVFVTHNRALCWSERTADETWSWHRRCSWNAGSTCVATDCSRRRNMSATRRTLSCSVSATWTCRTVACLRVCKTLCRRSGSSLYIKRRGYNASLDSDRTGVQNPARSLVYSKYIIVLTSCAAQKDGTSS